MGLVQQVKRPEDRYRGTPAPGYIKALRTSYAEPERVPKFERDRSTFYSDMFYRGKHRLFLSRSGWWKEIPQKSGQPDLYHPENYFAVLADGNRTEMVRAQVEFDVRAATESSKAVEGARAESAIAQYYQRRLFTESFRQELALRVQLQKSVGVYCWWDEAAGPKQETPDMRAVMRKPGPDAFACATCGAQGEASELLQPGALTPPAPEMAPDAMQAPPPTGPFGAPAEPDGDEMPGPTGMPMEPAGQNEVMEQPSPLCPQCGQPGVHVLEVPPVPSVEQVGVLYTPTGDVACEQVPSYEINCNSSARTVRVSGRTVFNNLFWLERERLIDRALADKLHPGRCDKFRNGSGPSDPDTRHMHYQQRVERTYGGTENDRTGWGSNASRLVEYRETWFLPEAYAEYMADSDHDLWDGTPEQPAQRIAKGQRLTDLFPDGMKIMWSGDEILEIKAEDARRHWRFVKIRQLPDSFWGRDFSDAIPLQILLNEFNSLILTNAMNNEAPRAIVNSLVVKNIGTYGHPGQLMTYETLPEGLGPGNLYEQFPGLPLAAPAYQYPDMVRRQMQATFGGNFEGAVSGEAGSENMKTATAWNVARARAVAKGQTMFALLAEGYAGILEVILDLFATNAKSDRIIEVQGDYAETETMALSGLQIGRDLEVTVKPGSVVPRQDDQLRTDFVEALDAESNYMQTHMSPTVPPSVALQIAERFNTPTMASDALKASRVARRCLEAMKGLAPMVPQAAMQAAQMQAAQIDAMPDKAPKPEGDPIPGAPVPPDPKEMKAQAAMALEAQMANPLGQVQLALGAWTTDPTSPVYIRPNGFKHELMAAWLEDWENRDEGLDADPMLVSLVEGFIDALRAAAIAKQAKAASVQMQAASAVQAPMEAEQRETERGDHAQREEISAATKSRYERDDTAKKKGSAARKR